MALPSHSDRTAPETGLGLALPPQLEQTLPETAAASVSQFCEMAPGIPWSNQTLDDMVETLKENSVLSKTTWGSASINASIFRFFKMVKKEEKVELKAHVSYCSGHRVNGYETAELFAEKKFPLDRNGVKESIEFLQKGVQNLKRRGMCEPCLALERPVKRIRVGETGLCASCLMRRAVFS
jgi:hypothetical protein